MAGTEDAANKDEQTCNVSFSSFPLACVVIPQTGCLKHVWVQMRKVKSNVIIIKKSIRNHYWER